jgi:hypothetical protein
LLKKNSEVLLGQNKGLLAKVKGFKAEGLGFVEERRGFDLTQLAMKAENDGLRAKLRIEEEARLNEVEDQLKKALKCKNEDDIRQAKVRQNVIATDFENKMANLNKMQEKCRLQNEEEEEKREQEQDEKMTLLLVNQLRGEISSLSAENLELEGGVSDLAAEVKKLRALLAERPVIAEPVNPVENFEVIALEDERVGALQLENENLKRTSDRFEGTLKEFLMGSQRFFKEKRWGGQGLAEGEFVASDEGSFFKVEKESMRQHLTQYEELRSYSR